MLHMATPSARRQAWVRSSFAKRAGCRTKTIDTMEPMVSAMSTYRAAGTKGGRRRRSVEASNMTASRSSARRICAAVGPRTRRVSGMINATPRRLATKIGAYGCSPAPTIRASRKAADSGRVSTARTAGDMSSAGSESRTRRDKGMVVSSRRTSTMPCSTSTRDCCCRNAWARLRFRFRPVRTKVPMGSMRALSGCIIQRGGASALSRPRRICSSLKPSWLRASDTCVCKPEMRPSSASKVSRCARNAVSVSRMLACAMRMGSRNAAGNSFSRAPAAVVAQAWSSSLSRALSCSTASVRVPMA
jgi:hypothetical protein